MGYKIKEMREKKEMSQEKLSELSGISRSIISGLESGRVTVRDPFAGNRVTTTLTLKKIAKALGVTVGEIFCDD